jgi:L-malate glycosyltransferase
MKPLRLALLIDFAPRRLGSFEDWLCAMAMEARERGHSVDIFAHDPIHPAVRERLAEAGAGWLPLAPIASNPLRESRRLARDYDLIHLTLFAPRSPASIAAYLAWPARVLFIDQFSGITGSAQDAASSPVRRSLSRLLDRLILLRIHGIGGVSEYVTQRGRARFGPAKLRTLYNGVKVDRYAPRGAGKASGDPVRIFSAAWLIPEKGMDLLLRAFAGLPAGRAELTIAGDGPEEGRLMALARELGIADRTTFLGLRNDLPELLDAADIFVHPARWAEAFGFAVAEAMACECAVVAANVGAMPELIRHEESGLLFEPDDPDALRAALAWLLEHPGARRRLSVAARQRVIENFSLERCVQQNLAWCEEICGSGSALTEDAAGQLVPAATR